MANLMHADLPSEDEEEDDDYNPLADKTGEKEDRPDDGKAKRRGFKRGRGAPAPVEEEEEAQEELDGVEAGPATALAKRERSPEESGPAMDAKSAAKRAKIEAVWQALNSRDTGGANASGAAGAPTNSRSLAALCGRARGSSGASDLTWQKQLALMAPQLQRKGVTAAGGADSKTLQHGSTAAAGASSEEQLLLRAGASGISGGVGTVAAAVSSCSPDEHDGSASASGAPVDVAVKAPSAQVSEFARSVAEAALSAAKEAASSGVARSYNKVSVTETKRFAGKDIQVTIQVEKDSKAAAKALKDAEKVAAASGLDRFLADLEKKKKVNILDKSKMDWNKMKSTDTTMEDEMEIHKRSSNKYLDKVDFLKKAELREYEMERDKRLAGDIRLRNRL